MIALLFIDKETLHKGEYKVKNKDACKAHRLFGLKGNWQKAIDALA